MELMMNRRQYNKYLANSNPSRFQERRRYLDKITGIPLSFAIVRVIMPDNNREISSKSADKYGRYYCLVPRGKYFVKIDKKNDDGSYSPAYVSHIIDATKTGIIKNNFRI